MIDKAFLFVRTLRVQIREFAKLFFTHLHKRYRELLLDSLELFNFKKYFRVMKLKKKERKKKKKKRKMMKVQKTRVM